MNKVNRFILTIFLIYLISGIIPDHLLAQCEEFLLTDCTMQLQTDNEWRFTTRDVYTYNENCQPTIILLEGWNTREWISNSRQVLTYDENNNHTRTLYEEPIWVGWLPGGKDTLIYDQANRLVERGSFFYQAESEPLWQPKQKIEYVYDEFGRVETESIFSWNYDYQELRLFSHLIYIYNPDGTIDEQIWQDCSEDTCINFQQTKFQYNEMGQETESIKRNWIPDDQSWTGSPLKYVSTYKDDLLIEKSVQDWFEEDWRNLARELFDYDDNGNRTVTTFQQMIDSDWQSYSILTCAYDSSPNSIENGETIVSSYKLHDNYPNPFNPSTKIAFELPQKSHVILSIYNLQGQLIKTLLNTQKPGGKHEVYFDASTLSSGTYLYRLKTPTVDITKRMLYLK